MSVSAVRSSAELFDEPRRLPEISMMSNRWSLLTADDSA
jgi:hypothetical protein